MSPLYIVFKEQFVFAYEYNILTLYSKGVDSKFSPPLNLIIIDLHSVRKVRYIVEDDRLYDFLHSSVRVKISSSFF